MTVSLNINLNCLFKYDYFLQDKFYWTKRPLLTFFLRRKHFYFKTQFYWKSCHISLDVYAATHWRHSNSFFKRKKGYLQHQCMVLTLKISSFLRRKNRIMGMMKTWYEFDIKWIVQRIKSFTLSGMSMIEVFISWKHGSLKIISNLFLPNYFISIQVIFVQSCIIF